MGRQVRWSAIRFVGRLDLESTLYSGQAFRWRRLLEDAHEGFVRNLPVRVRARGSTLEWTGDAALDDDVLRSYFRLDETHEQAMGGRVEDPYLRRALERFPGLRLLRQDPWETLVSFILSQNSNEPKIRGTIERLCALAGHQVGVDRRAFPTAAELGSLDEAGLRSTGTGYRAAYVAAAAREVAAGRLDPDTLTRIPYAEAFERLLRLPGVGEKVADCILLYGCGHLAAFPTDVWVRRFIRETYYRPRRAATHERIRAFAWRHFGPSAGYAQHYLFHYRRTVGPLEASPA